jgi:structural maintenance of chromosome 1
MLLPAHANPHSPTDNTNVGRVARYVQARSEKNDFQCVPPLSFPSLPRTDDSLLSCLLLLPHRCIVITHKQLMFESSSALVGIYREGGSKTLTLDLTQYDQGV